MAQHMKVGTKLDLGGDPLDVYVVERITHTTVDSTKVYRIEARTERQRCFPRDLTGYTTWTDAELRTKLAQGMMTIL